MLPPISRQEAETEFGLEISETAWGEICKAFRRHGRRLHNLEGMLDNRNRNDPQSWNLQKLEAKKKIDAALMALATISRDFLVQAEENVSLRRSGGIESYGPVQRLENAMDEILVLSWFVKEAQPLPQEFTSESLSRKALAHDVFVALEGAGATLSNRWKLEQGEPSNADLTGFERLVELLNIHQGATPKATAKWISNALAQER